MVEMLRFLSALSARKSEQHSSFSIEGANTEQSGGLSCYNAEMQGENHTGGLTKVSNRNASTHSRRAQEVTA
jgi:hypothetical protein